MKNLKNKSICIAIYILLSFSSSSAQQYFQKKDLQQDLEILKSNLEKLHAGLYTYSTKQEIDDWFSETKSNLPDSLNRFEFYKAVAPLNSIIKNGHTAVRYPAFGKEFKFVPIQLYKYKKGFFIRKVLSKDTLELAGKQIISIDNKPIEEIFSKLIINQTRDGNNLSMPEEDLQKYFGLSYPLVYGQKQIYKLTLKDGEKEVSVDLESQILSKETIKRFRSGSAEPLLDFRIQDSTAILTFKTFDSKRLRKEKYKRFLAESFSEIQKKNINNLILDVRDNGGGDPVPTQELISYLYDKPFKMYEDVYTITNKIEDKQYFKKEGIFWLNALAWTKVKKVANNHYRRRNDEGMDIYQPKQNAFTGNLHILANGNSFSATGEFTSFIESVRETTFVGEEVGGNREQNTSGVGFNIILPNSKQKVLIPLVLWVMNVPKPATGHGVKPNYWVRNTIEQELKGIDSVMKFTLNLISK